ncbi:uncharacterized protein MEPE_01984 [Melanopsichium pennsylvanicum]|uniref:Uncharacterized protein n=2 Tax=Melanopsichium pennsylvanicum TaxID=63383 RepID=A0AAJ4XJS1_9BASI|nr:conserved hypothetical protein [Melanopsichium pennsylvanicum 4]SNX83277.1 uncharacterized protein MEPE_01984 [Melanopsichium pennsylvanicum]
MGSVFSCLASTFSYLGEFLENVFLAIGEVGAVLVRGIIGIVVTLCDLLAAISCCYRVPWSERPDRSFYTYTVTNTVPEGANTMLTQVGSKQVLSNLFTKEGREQRKQITEARKKAVALEAEEDAAVRSAKKQEEVEKAAKADAEKREAGDEKERAALKAEEEKKAAAVKV